MKIITISSYENVAQTSDSELLLLFFFSTLFIINYFFWQNDIICQKVPIERYIEILLYIQGFIKMFSLPA